jgi:hypothetical protein
MDFQVIPLCAKYWDVFGSLMVLWSSLKDAWMLAALSEKMAWWRLRQQKSSHCHEKFVRGHVCGRFKVQCCSHASKEKYGYIAFSPAKYNSVTANYAEGSTRSACKVASSSWPQALLVICMASR